MLKRKEKHHWNKKKLTTKIINASNTTYVRVSKETRIFGIISYDPIKPHTGYKSNNDLPGSKEMDLIQQPKRYNPITNLYPPADLDE